MPLNIQEPRPSAPPTGFALFALGFRPFFLLAGIAAVILLLFWLRVPVAVLRNQLHHLHRQLKRPYLPGPSSLLRLVVL